MIPDWLKPALKPAVEAWLRCKGYSTTAEALIIPVYKGALSWRVESEDTCPGENGSTNLFVEVLRVRALPADCRRRGAIDVAGDRVVLVAYGHRTAWVGVNSLVKL